MQNRNFTWDENKNKANKRKHGIGFEEAQSVFNDPKAIFGYDEAHSDYEEERFIVIGMSFGHNVLMVCHCYRNYDLETRIISARKADENEQLDYWRQSYDR